MTDNHGDTVTPCVSTMALKTEFLDLRREEGQTSGLSQLRGSTEPLSISQVALKMQRI